MNLERSAADVGARRFRPALRDAILSVIRRGQVSRLPQAVRTRLARVLSLEGPAFDAEAQSLLNDLATLDAISPRAAAGAVGGMVAADATATTRRRP